MKEIDEVCTCAHLCLNIFVTNNKFAIGVSYTMVPKKLYIWILYIWIHYIYGYYIYGYIIYMDISPTAQAV